MRILDCFPYFNEKELLELRINLLYDYVDQFIIIDADHTHSGKPKEFTCKNILKELGLLKDKVKVVEIILPSYEEEPNAWVRETSQRNEIAKYIQDGDVAIVSDCDEIINPEYVKYYASTALKYPNNILRIPMVFLNCRADLRVYHEDGYPIKWNVPFMCMKNHIQNCTLSNIREVKTIFTNVYFNDIFITENGIIEDVGWHFGWMGNYERMKQKCDSFLHYNEVTVKQNFVPEINGPDPLDREILILKPYSKNLLPSKLFELERVKTFLLPNYKLDHIYKNSEFGEDWFTYPNLYSNMVNEFPSGSKFVEVGSWKGKSSSYMAVEIANSNKNIEFTCIDTWEGSIEHQDYKDLNNLYDIFIENMKPLKKYYKPLKMKSLDAVNLFPDNSIDFVFIDASHEYEDVKKDILAWLPKVKKGGVLAGHDYYENIEYGDGVKKAVDEIFNHFTVQESCFIVRV